MGSIILASKMARTYPSTCCNTHWTQEWQLMKAKDLEPALDPLSDVDFVICKKHKGSRCPISLGGFEGLMIRHIVHASTYVTNHATSRVAHTHTHTLRHHSGRHAMNHHMINLAPGTMGRSPRLSPQAPWRPSRSTWTCPGGRRCRRTMKPSSSGAMTFNL